MIFKANAVLFFCPTKMSFGKPSATILDLGGPFWQLEGTLAAMGVAEWILRGPESDFIDFGWTSGSLIFKVFPALWSSICCCLFILVLGFS